MCKCSGVIFSVQILGKSMRFSLSCNSQNVTAVGLNIKSHPLKLVVSPYGGPGVTNVLLGETMGGIGDVINTSLYLKPLDTSRSHMMSCCDLQGSHLCSPGNPQ